MSQAGDFFHVQCSCGQVVPESGIRYPIEWNTCLRREQCTVRGFRSDEPPWPGRERGDDEDDPRPTAPTRPVAPASV